MNDAQRPLENADGIIPVFGEPIDVWEQINKYGTYEVQDTTDTDNVFPTIGPTGGWKACLDLPNAVQGTKKTEP